MYQPDKLFPLPESLPAETVRETWRQVLLDAAEYIRVHGWWHYHQECVLPGSQCISNAIGKVTGDPFHEAHKRLMEHLAVDGLGMVYNWNDTPGRTASEAIAALEGAARSALREGGGK